MNFQEIFVLLFVVIAAVFSLRTFVKQFSSNNSTCASCSCEPLAKKAVNRNTIRFKKIKPF